jgi:hypothetical protein
VQQVVPRRRSELPERVATAMGYVMLLAIGLVAFALVTNQISRGWLRSLVYATLLGTVWAIAGWILAGRSATRSVALSGDGLVWTDQRMRKGSMRRDAVSRIEQHRYRTPLGPRTGAWVVDTAGRARVKLMPRFPPNELASALSVPLVVAQGLAQDQRELERLLPGSGELAMRNTLIRYVIPVGLGFAALALNAYA